ncbi:MAG: dTMP kinase [Rhodospirillaceae bacterium]|nr:dTMP kinase [Rhodospirillaceae bacterium]
MPGLFITFEGGEGAGKSTQVKRLGEQLQARGREVVLTREPGGAPGAEAIRKLLVEGAASRWDGITEALLHTAARRDHLVKTVWPALAAGKVVISDRFVDSTIAYQGYGHGIDRAVLDSLYRAAAGDFRPNLTVIIDVPLEIGLKRAAGRGGAENRYENMDRTFHERLRQGFLALAAAEPARCKIVDGTKGLDQVHAEVMAAVTPLLG